MCLAGMLLVWGKACVTQATWRFVLDAGVQAHCLFVGMPVSHRQQGSSGCRICRHGFCLRECLCDTGSKVIGVCKQVLA